jgi:hypothetical protein
MDPITLIVAALAAGAALGITDTASSAIKDAYAGLKSLVRERLGDGPKAEMVLAGHEQAPETWRVPLMAELDQAGARNDSGLVSAAEALMHLVGEAEVRAGKFTLDVRGAQGVQVGDRNTQHNVFGASPGGLRPPPSGSAPSRSTEADPDEL